MERDSKEVKDRDGYELMFYYNFRNPSAERNVIQCQKSQWQLGTSIETFLQDAIYQGLTRISDLLVIVYHSFK
jgi:hypothetical protein